LKVETDESPFLIYNTIVLGIYFLNGGRGGRRSGAYAHSSRIGSSSSAQMQVVCAQRDGGGS
jgi:hypothetical protein